jgi:hypothetical protein
MVLWHPVEFSQMPFRLIPEVFDAIEVLGLLHKLLRMINSIVFEF